MSIRIALALLFFFAPLFASASEPEALRGVVASVTQCGSGSIIRLTDGGVLIYQNGPLFPLGATIAVGQTLYALTRATSTCNTEVGKAVLAIAVSVPGAGSPGGGTGGGSGSGSGSGSGQSGGQNQLNQLMESAKSRLQSLLNPAAAAPSVTGIPFGGPILAMDICLEGKIWVMLGPPTPGPFIWGLGTISYAYGPPSFIGQHLLGIAGPPDVCVLGAFLTKPGIRILMHGSSGPGVPSAPTAPQKQPAQQPSKVSCSQLGSPNTPAGKRAAEDAVRKELLKCDIEVISSRTGGRPCAFGQDGLAGGCTDVSGLSCSALTGICDIAKKCPLKIIGGSEGGHHTTGTGREIDVIMDPDCMRKHFVPYGTTGCRFRDPVSGTTFLDEIKCDTPRKTGDHIHICIGGRGC